MRDVENTGGNESSGAIAITSAVSLCWTVKLASAESPAWITSRLPARSAAARERMLSRVASFARLTTFPGIPVESIPLRGVRGNGSYLLTDAVTSAEFGTFTASQLRAGFALTLAAQNSSRILLIDPITTSPEPARAALIASGAAALGALVWRRRSR
jgi:hypothetical protein